MKIVLFSDLHGNLPVLESLYKIEKDADLFVSLGDVVGYGPWINESIDFLAAEKYKTVLLRGNHEEMYLRGQISKEISQHIRESFEYNFPRVGVSRLDFINSWLANYQIEGLFCQHTWCDLRIYANTDLSNYGSEYPQTVIGHTHVQFSRKFRDGGLLSNVGSLGQNRSFKGIAAYAIFYKRTGCIEFKAFSYSPNELVNQLRIQGMGDKLVSLYT